MTETFDLDWCGFWSNVFMGCAVALFLAFIGFLVHVVLRVLREMKRDKESTQTSPRAATWPGAFLFIVGLAIKVMTAVFAGGWGTTTAGSTTRETPSGWLGISLVGLVLFPMLLYFTVLKENPLRLSVSSEDVDLIYRLPWRDTKIPLASITDVRLQRHDYLNRGGGKSHFYTLTLAQHGQSTTIPCSQRPWYEQQIQTAYRAICRRIGKQYLQGRD